MINDKYDLTMKELIVLIFILIAFVIVAIAFGKLLWLAIILPIYNNIVPLILGGISGYFIRKGMDEK